jgi:hypothetical protein
MVLGWSVISLAWWSATSATATHQAAPVPPTQEIELLDPNVHPRGLPAVVPTRGPDGVMQIDVPPAVLVHKYY